MLNVWNNSSLYSDKFALIGVRCLFLNSTLRGK